MLWEQAKAIPDQGTNHVIAMIALLILAPVWESRSMWLE
jgi:hypothetical protein